MQSVRFSAPKLAAGIGLGALLAATAAFELQAQHAAATGLEAGSAAQHGRLQAGAARVADDGDAGRQDPARQAQGAGRLQGRGLGARHARRAHDGPRRQGHDLRRHARDRQGLRHHRQGRQAREQGDRRRPAAAERHRLQERHALRHHASTRRCASTASRTSSTPRSRPTSARRSSCRRPRTTTGSSRPSAPTTSSTSSIGSPCNVCEINTGMHGLIRRQNLDGSEHRDRGARRAQLGRLRLAPADQGAVVHRQRPRLGRRCGTGRGAEPRRRQQRRAASSASPTATPTASPIPTSRSPTRAPASRCRPPRSARMPPRSACASTPATCSRPTTRTTPSSPGAARGTATKKFGYDVVQAKINGGKATITPFLTGFLDTADRRVLGPAGRRAADARRRAAGVRRAERRDLSRLLHGQGRQQVAGCPIALDGGDCGPSGSQSPQLYVSAPAGLRSRRRGAAGAAAAVRHLPWRERQLQDGEDALARRTAGAVSHQPADPVSRAPAQVGGDGAVRQGPDGRRDPGAGGALRQADA